MRRPIAIPARAERGESDDPMFLYSLLARLWRRDGIGEMTEEQRKKTAIFRNVDGTPLCTDDMGIAVKAAVGALGLNAADYSGVSGRIGGATDIRARFGCEQGRKFLQAFGRWGTGSDIAFIYARVTAGEMISAAESLDLYAGEEEAVEELLQGWAQPAVRVAG